MADVEFYPDLPSKTAVLLYTLSKSQACPDGNKRAALILVETFLGLNDATLDAPEDVIASRIEEAADSDRPDRDRMLRELTNWLGGAIAPLSEGA